MYIYMSIHTLYLKDMHRSGGDQYYSLFSALRPVLLIHLNNADTCYIWLKGSACMDTVALYVHIALGDQWEQLSFDQLEAV